jgi:MFS transporter, PPP family, 3-phenylpropionic acid transporter
MLASIHTSVLARFVLLFALMYAAFGFASPFLPAFLAMRGLAPEEIAIVLGAGTAVRLMSGPAVGRIADWLQGLRLMLGLTLGLAALAALGYLRGSHFATLLVVGLLHQAALAPTTTLADALALGAAVRSPRFEYGWVRGAGSAAFILGSIVAGYAIGIFGLASIVWAQAATLALAAMCARLVPELPLRARLSGGKEHAAAARALSLFAIPRFRRLILVAALVLGSHAMHDSFAVIRWSAGGISPSAAGILWSEAVAAEVLVFFLVGPALVNRLGTAGALSLAAGAGVLRWSVMALSVDVMALALVQPLHGLTFALLHLACMRQLAAIVPPGLSASAQAIYGTLAAGAMTAVLTFAAGPLYGRFGGGGFWPMAALCAAALPVAWTLRDKQLSRDHPPCAQ